MLPNPHVVIPSPETAENIAAVADMRVREVASRKGLQVTNREQIRAWHDREETGCLGEWAVCAYYGVPWIPAARGQVDVFPNIQVRTTRTVGGHLCHLTTDNPRQRYVLVYAHGYPYQLCAEVVGWLWGKECRVPAWREYERWDGWAVPKGGLRKPGTLAVPTPPNIQWSRYA